MILCGFWGPVGGMCPEGLVDCGTEVPLEKPMRSRTVAPVPRLVRGVGGRQFEVPLIPLGTQGVRPEGVEPPTVRFEV